MKQKLHLKNSSVYWGWVSISFHWLMAMLVITLFILGLWMVELTYYDDWYRTAPDIHKSAGVLLLLIIVFHFMWRIKNVKPDGLLTYTKFENRASRLTHVIMYILLILIIFSGYLISTADGRGIEVFGLFEVPAIVYGLDQQEDVSGVIHLVLAVSLMLLVCVHAAAALKHHFVDKDKTLKRMLGMSNDISD